MDPPSSATYTEADLYTMASDHGEIVTLGGHQSYPYRTDVPKVQFFPEGVIFDDAAAGLGLVTSFDAWAGSVYGATMTSVFVGF